MTVKYFAEDMKYFYYDRSNGALATSFEPVGTSMIAQLDCDGLESAEKLAPDKGALSGIIECLYSIFGEQTFVKGHLLNAKCGGDNKNYNLFPITEAANHIHSKDVESTIKRRVDGKKIASNSKGNELKENQQNKITYRVDILPEKRPLSVLNPSCIIKCSMTDHYYKNDISFAGIKSQAPDKQPSSLLDTLNAIPSSSGSIDENLNDKNFSTTDTIEQQSHLMEDSFRTYKKAKQSLDKKFSDQKTYNTLVADVVSCLDVLHYLSHDHSGVRVGPLLTKAQNLLDRLTFDRPTDIVPDLFSELKRQADIQSKQIQIDSIFEDSEKQTSSEKTSPLKRSRSSAEDHVGSEELNKVKRFKKIIGSQDDSNI